MTRSVAGMVVLVTGGSAGIGRVTARRLAARGAHVAICGRDPGLLAAAAEAIPGSWARRCDVTVTDPARKYGRRL